MHTVPAQQGLTVGKVSLGEGVAQKQMQCRVKQILALQQGRTTGKGVAPKQNKTRRSFFPATAL